MRKPYLMLIIIILMLTAGCSGLLTPVETAGPDCQGDEINLIGESIAEEYDSASYEQVMIWFCNGAEFEDILVALETEASTGLSADELLTMVADGASWERIWSLIGFTE